MSLHVHNQRPCCIRTLVMYIYVVLGRQFSVQRYFCENSTVHLHVERDATNNSERLWARTVRIICCIFYWTNCTCIKFKCKFSHICVYLPIFPFSHFDQKIHRVLASTVLGGRCIVRHFMRMNLAQISSQVIP